jgi:LPS export ABC transporter protein LptC
MDRLARRILVAVGLFVVLVASVLVAKSRTVRTESVGPRLTNADLAVKELHLEEESGGVRWQLTADQAAVFEQEKRTALRKVHVRVKDRDRAWTITGEEGDLYQDRNDLEVRRDVVMVSDDGLRLETSVLRWVAADKRLWTDKPVRIYRERTVIDGTGLDVHMQTEATTVQGRVQATFNGSEASAGSARR